MHLFDGGIGLMKSVAGVPGCIAPLLKVRRGTLGDLQLLMALPFYCCWQPKQVLWGREAAVVGEVMQSGETERLLAC